MKRPWCRTESCCPWQEGSNWNFECHFIFIHNFIKLAIYVSIYYFWYWTITYRAIYFSLRVFLLWVWHPWSQVVIVPPARSERRGNRSIFSYFWWFKTQKTFDIFISLKNFTLSRRGALNLVHEGKLCLVSLPNKLFTSTDASSPSVCAHSSSIFIRTFLRTWTSQRFSKFLAFNRK